MAQASEKKRLNILRNELAWVQRGARARSTKQKARLQRFEELKNVKGPVMDGKVELTSAASRLGRTTVEIENVSKSYGDKVLIRDFTYLFGKDDRVGFIGPNGSGKTTLMKMILGEVAPDSGHIEMWQNISPRRMDRSRQRECWSGSCFPGKTSTDSWENCPAESGADCNYARS